jgi:molybdopterin-containing oxidoreductase family iron-sulfur binding subunit
MTKHCAENKVLYQLDAPSPGGERRLWRSLEEFAESPQVRARLLDEFPAGAAVWDDPVGRRRFLQLMGASMALAGITGCIRQPAEKIMPYVRPPEQLIPGKPLFFATAMPQDHGVGLGLLVESHMGRPTKIEGNADHPASLGATNAIAQASILGLYDPHRSQVVRLGGDVSLWESFYRKLSDVLRQPNSEEGRGLRVLCEPSTSPTLAAQRREFLERYPQARWHEYDPVMQDAAVTGTRLAFGAPLNSYYRFDQARIIVSLASDFLGAGPACVRYTHDFAATRRPYDGATMSRLYAVEVTPTNTGAMADHRLSLRPSEVEAFAIALAQEMQLPLGDLPRMNLPPERRRWISAIANDLRQSQGTSIVIAGAEQPPVVQAIAHALNHAQGNIGRTVIYTEPLNENPTASIDALRDLVEAMDAGEVQALIILGGNPVYDSPVDFHFAERLKKVPFRAHLSLENDETSSLCQWHLPRAHYLEAWSDVRAFDGTATIMQPLIAPLYQGRSIHEVVAALNGKAGQGGHDIVRNYWRSQHADDFERFWQQSVHDGIVADTRLPAKTPTLVGNLASGIRQAIGTPAPEITANNGYELVLRPDPTIYDGRYAGNGWLQELPKPLTTLTWDNAFLINPQTAAELGVRDQDVIEVTVGDHTISGPVFRLPNQPLGTFALHLGYGRQSVAILDGQTGINAYQVRTAARPWGAVDVAVRKTGERYVLAQTQQHWSMMGRDLVRTATLQEFEKHPDFARPPHRDPEPNETLYPTWKYDGYAWGMAIDLNACTGCGACVVACQAENNIPVVGKEQVARSREMHWLRIDRYYEGEESFPDNTHFQPVMCMHCEHAPCEPVCPVEATAHSAEGLNDMVYNRCVGTRYCSNNCPYKVRRFNFLQFADFETPSLKLMYNPDVTVRSRGVMEKCTYCVQRIVAGRTQAEIENRKVRDGEILTACQAACPAQALVFGDLNNPESQVAKLAAKPLNYGLLTELNTRPRTTYMAHVTNPNPALANPSRREEHA